MGGIYRFQQQISRMLIKATWLLLLFNGFYSVCRYTSGNGAVPPGSIVTLFIIYGGWLYFLQQKNKPTTTLQLAGEAFLILCIDTIASFQVAVFLLPLLIIRRACYAKIPNIYNEALCIAIAYMLAHGLLSAKVDLFSWLHQRASESFIIALSAIVVQPVIRMVKALKSDKEKLNRRLDLIEESYQQAAERAVRDDLTGLYNYRAFQEDIQRIGQKRFALLLIDVDYFKAFNDSYGHAAGDEALKQVGQVISESVRLEDKVYRYGGEEFAVVLENADENIAMFTAERLRIRIADRAIFHDDQELSGVTVSVGVSVFEQLTMPIKEIFEMTDKALYKAKAIGRNKVVRVDHQQTELVFEN